MYHYVLLYSVHLGILSLSHMHNSSATGCSLDPLSYQVNEGEAPLFVDINVITTDPAGAGTSCVLSTEDGSADPADAAATGGKYTVRRCFQNDQRVALPWYCHGHLILVLLLGVFWKKITVCYFFDLHI